VTATISWLDASADEQRRAREIVRMFSQRETQDEMGARRIVIALSDALFPGTSVLHTRARYLVLIPHLMLVAAQRSDPVRQLDTLERRMIVAFLENTSVSDADRTDGLIGRRAGKNVKQLPSTAYWTALEAWGILRRPGSIETTLDRSRRRPGGNADADEFVDRAESVWHPAVHRFSAELGKGFPTDDIGDGFRLSGSEAAWLRERWLDGDRVGRSLLAHLALADRPLDATAPWDEPHCSSAGADHLELLDQARRFSFVNHGASLLYSTMVAEQYVAAGHTRVDVDVDAYRAAIDDWAATFDDASSIVTPGQHLFSGWQPDAFWALLSELAVRDTETARFYDIWFDRIRSGDLDGIADDRSLREAARRRERMTKGPAGRLAGGPLLATWGGGMAGPTTYRWAQVQRLVNDVLAGLGISGLEGDDAGA